MKIAILSSIHWRTPPQKYGPWELIASYVAEGMVKRGHEVTLYATGDSETGGKLRWICPRPIMEDPGLESKVYQYLHTSLVFEEANDFDIIHNHFDAYPLVFSKLTDTPVVTTIHGFSSPQVNEIYKKYSNTYFVSISDADRRHAPDLNYIDTIYHGINLEDFKFNDKPDDYFIYVGRISNDKGVHLSIDLARKLGIKLKIAGIVDVADRDYFDNTIKPQLGTGIEYLGVIEEDDKKDLMSRARGFLHMNTYPEGFGLTLIESMALGTPVIGVNKGSVPEVIEDGKTGFVIDTIGQAEDAVKKIDVIDRKVCRKRVEKYFSLERMLDDYEEVYNIILNNK
jgi:glycosyltransferase involved in cell wall biosynthesis